MKARLPVRKAILERKTYEAPAEGRAKMIRLDFNENTMGCSRAVTRALGQMSLQAVAMYPEYEKPTRTVARYFGVRPSEVLLTNGGDDALRVFFDTFVDADSSILICEPTFPMYRYYAEIAGARVEALRYGPEMEFPLEAVLSAVKQRPRVMFIANPNNPTGTLISKEQIKKILEAAPETAVVIDEAYAEFCDTTMTGDIAEYPHLFVTRTFSKAAGLAALRLGAVIAKAESLALLRRAMPPFPVNLAALVAAQTAIKDGRATRRYVREVQRSRARVAKELRAMGAKPFPSAGNFLMVSFGESGRRIFRELAKKKILIRERPDCGLGCARITIGTTKEMDQVLRVIARVRNKR